ncbi:MAG: hypothetical protein CMJ18_22920 [Phycisphaeraceae bacterium]|nr:hypothetical protein [Phycisphaeraceae bacterium]
MIMRNRRNRRSDRRPPASCCEWCGLEALEGRVLFSADGFSETSSVASQQDSGAVEVQGEAGPPADAAASGLVHTLDTSDVMYPQVADSNQAQVKGWNWEEKKAICGFAEPVTTTIGSDPDTSEASPNQD